METEKLSVVKRGDTPSGHTMPRDILCPRIRSHFHVTFFVDFFRCPSNLFACGNPAAIELSHSPTPLHMVDYDPLIKGQLAFTRNSAQGLEWCQYGHDTPWN